MKYNTINLTDQQLEAVTRVLELLEISKQGPYGGNGGSVSKGQAIAYACRTILKRLEEQVERTVNEKRLAAKSRRQNNNPGITLGITNRPRVEAKLPRKDRGTVYGAR